MLIIGILAAIALPQYKRAVTRSQLAQFIITNRAITDAQERYFLENGVYASYAADLDADVVPPDFKSCGNFASDFFFNGQEHLTVSSVGWSRGWNITAYCPATPRKDVGIITYPPGNQPTICPATEKRPCTFCSERAGISGNLKGICASFGKNPVVYAGSTWYRIF